MYVIKKIEKEISCINDKIWDSAEVADIDKINWKEFGRNIKTTGKLLYNGNGIYVRLETDEKPLLARFSKQNELVCQDSCMELFLKPDKNDIRYLNFEFNPFGTMYFAIITPNKEDFFPDKNKEYFRVMTNVDEKSWVLQFFIPFEFIKEAIGGYTDTMYGNLYKCGNETVKKHYISYYPVITEEPGFHRPEFFGEFVLEK